MFFLKTLLISILVPTNYTNIDTAVTLFSSPTFFESVFEKMNIDKPEYDPEFKGDVVDFPLRIAYKTSPLIGKLSLPKMDFTQYWTMPTKNSYRNTITAKNIMKVQLDYKVKKENNLIYIEIEGKWIKKMFGTPSFVLKEIMNQMKNIITDLV